MTALLAALVVSAAPASFLGVVAQGDDASARTLLAACPRLVVFPLPGTAVSTQLTALKAACPGTTAVAQLQGSAEGAAAFAAQWPLWLPQLQAVGTARLDGVEGPPGSTSGAAALASFWPAFAAGVRGAGLLPLVDASATALRAPAPAPDGGAEDGFCAIARALAPGAYGWTWHAASAMSATDAATEPALGYRAVRDACGLERVPLLETGLRPAGRSWQEADLSWLAWLDGELAQDATRGDLRGAALVQAGAPDAPPLSPSLLPIATPLAAYLANPQPGDGGAPDGGDGGGGDGGSSDGGPDGGGAGGIVPPPVPSGGELVPSNPKGCSCSSPGAGALALAAALLAARRRERRQR